MHHVLPYGVLQRLLCLVVLLTILLVTCSAEVVVLRSGQRVQGELLLNNDEVVILRTKDGLRYQYPKAEVVSVQADPVDMATAVDAAAVRPQKKVALLPSVAGGVALVPHLGTGGMMDAHLAIGTHNLMNQHIFLGGEVGYRGVFVGKDAYSWIPLQLVLRSPLAGQKLTRHRPLIGANVGYAFSTNQRWGGGMCAGIDIGWWYKISDRSHFSLSLTAQWQQTRIHITETIHQSDYDNFVGCNIVGIGLKMSIQF